MIVQCQSVYTGELETYKTNRLLQWHTFSWLCRQMSPGDICWLAYIYAGIYTTYIHIKCLLPNVFLAYLWFSSCVAWAQLVTEMEQQERHSSNIGITAEKVAHTPLVAPCLYSQHYGCGGKRIRNPRSLSANHKFKASLCYLEYMGNTN